MSIRYVSTRDVTKEKTYTASQAILQGIAKDGGLFVPDKMPSVAFDWDVWSKKTYQEVAADILQLFLTDYTKEEIEYCVNAAYDQKFDTSDIAPVKKVGEHYVLELFHGNTIAFKDMALSILPYLLITASKKQQSDKDIVILTATSGDTGKAAMAGFADVPHTKIIVFYPKDGVSQIQERQMITQKGENTTVIAIRGNFDDAQTKVKELFMDDALNQELATFGYQFSSANSINIGRLVPQVAYYVYAYAALIKQKVLVAGEQMNVSVPTGNFGNILAAYFAKQIGVPIKTLVCASNKNNVLVDFFNNGIYDRKRPFFVTTSPSMDILVSSNLERLVYQITSNNAKETKALMQELQEKGEYTIDESMKARLEDFVAGFATEEETATVIQQEFVKNGYVFDPHTAVAVHVYQQYQQQTQDNTPVVIASTASPYKFPRSVMAALQSEIGEDDFELVEELHKTSHVPIPDAVTSVLHAPVRHT